jgi:hypothetical protein
MKIKTMSTSEQEPRKRKTKAQREAERSAQMKAETEKPIDPKIWLFLGGLLLFVALFIYVDPLTFAEAGQPGGEGMWIRDVLVIIVGILGKTPTVIVLGFVSLLSIGWGLRGWLRQRSSADNPPPPTP